MPIDNHDCVVELSSLIWPVALRVPTARFRLFVAADTANTTTETLTEFVHTALKLGMVYFCAWGAGCERFHDIVDAAVVEDYLGKRLLVGPDADDAIMTTWHENDTLEDAAEYFVTAALPTDGFIPDSNYWIAMCLNNPRWATTIRHVLERSEPLRLR